MIMPVSAIALPAAAGGGQLDGGGILQAGMGHRDSADDFMPFGDAAISVASYGAAIRDFSRDAKIVRVMPIICRSTLMRARKSWQCRRRQTLVRLGSAQPQAVTSSARILRASSISRSSKHHRHLLLTGRQYGYCRCAAAAMVALS